MNEIPENDTETRVSVNIYVGSQDYADKLSDVSEVLSKFEKNTSLLDVKTFVIPIFKNPTQSRMLRDALIDNIRYEFESRDIGPESN